MDPYPMQLVLLLQRKFGHADMWKVGISFTQREHHVNTEVMLPEAKELAEAGHRLGIDLSQPLQREQGPTDTCFHTSGLQNGGTVSTCCLPLIV